MRAPRAPCRQAPRAIARRPVAAGRRVRARAVGVLDGVRRRLRLCLILGVAVGSGAGRALLPLLRLERDPARAGRQMHHARMVLFVSGTHHGADAAHAGCGGGHPVNAVQSLGLSDLACLFSGALCNSQYAQPLNALLQCTANRRIDRSRVPICSYPTIIPTLYRAEHARQGRTCGRWASGRRRAAARSWAPWPCQRASAGPPAAASSTPSWAPRAAAHAAPPPPGRGAWTT